MKCGHCNSTLVAGAKFCSECGVMVAWCRQCNNALVDGANFCSECGAKVSGIGQSGAVANSTGARTTNRQLKQHVLDVAQESGGLKLGEQAAEKRPRAGWHIDSVITQDELARAAGISFWPAFIAWVVSRFARDNPRFCAWGAGITVMFVSLIAIAQYRP